MATRSSPVEWVPLTYALDWRIGVLDVGNWIIRTGIRRMIAMLVEVVLKSGEILFISVKIVSNLLNKTWVFVARSPSMG